MVDGFFVAMMTQTENTELDLRQLQLADEHLDVLAENCGPEQHFRLKHIDELDLGSLYALRNHDLIERDVDFTWGRATNWTSTEVSKQAVARLQSGDVPTELLDELDEYSVDVVNRHIDLIEQLPNGEKFRAAEYELNGSLLGALNKANLVERIEQYSGSPDVWQKTAFATHAVAEISSEGNVDVESTAEAEVADD